MRAPARGESIRRSLSFAIAIAVLIALSITGTILMPLAQQRRMDTLVDQLRTKGLMLAYNLVASVDFDDRGDARRVLSCLSASPTVKRSWVVRGEEGTVFQSYCRNEPLGALPPIRSGRFGDVILVSVDIREGERVLGQLVLEDDLSTYRAGFWMDLGALVSAMFVAFAALMLLTGRLARRITDPITRLAAQAQKISKGEDYSLQIETNQGGEIGTLFRAFDDMLRRIRTRDSDLVVSRGAAEARAEEAERARADLAITLNSMADAFLACDAQGLITRINPVAETLTGWTAADAIGKPIEEVYVLVDAESGERVMAPSGAATQDGPAPASGATVLVAKGGVRTPVMGHNAPIHDEAGRVVGAVLVARDVRKQLELEEQLRQSLKMEAVGKLAGGVAHDFNNLLTGILGFSDLLEQELRAANVDRDTLELLTGVRTTAKRAADLTWQLLAFSRRGSLKRERVDVHEILRATVKLLKHTINPKITIELDLQAEDPFVIGDASQLQSAFLNLGVNARDAMAAGGKLTFATRNTYLVADVAASLPFKPAEGRYLEVATTDTGVGIAPEHLDQIFEPFFTTKKIGEGTGLGLAAVHGTVQSHSGSIVVSSERGKGSRFVAYLPEAATGAEESPVLLTRGDAVSAAESLKVLIVDDEEILRSVARRLFVHMGWQTYEAKNGKEGVARFRDLHGELNLVLLDMQMPEMDGAEAFDLMQSIDVAVPILVTTGNSVEQAKVPGIVANQFLQKPYTLESLAAAIQRVMPTRVRGEQ